MHRNPEHNYTKMLKFMSKSLNSFKKGIPKITKPFIDNIDFLIINLPYFTEIEMVYEYFVTSNTEFNKVFKSKIETFLWIMYYDSTLPKHDDDRMNELINSALDYFENDNQNIKLDKASRNKLVLWQSVLGRSTMDKLKSSWLSTAEQEDTGISTLNDTNRVLELFYTILNYHYSSIKHVIMSHVDFNKLLEHLNINDTIIRNLVSDIKSRYLLRGIKNICNILLDSGKYDILEIYLSDYDLDINSSEENSVDVIDFNSLYYRFLSNNEYLNYKLLFNILIKIVDYSDIKIPIYMSLFNITNKKIVCKNMKIYLYIRLICHNSKFILDEIFENDLHLYFIDLFFDNKNNQFLHSCIFKFIKIALSNIKYKDTILNLLSNKLSIEYKEGYAKSVGSNPQISNIFPYSYLLSNKNNRFRILESIKYSDFNKIDEYIDQCYEESFVRYVCRLVINEVPVLNVLEKDV